MGFFARFPEVFRSIGNPWRSRSIVLPPLAEMPSAAQSPAADIAASTSEDLCKAHAQVPKLRTICSTSDYRAESRAKSVRMVISGRMADVCAELDRLVALEAQPTLH